MNYQNLKLIQMDIKILGTGCPRCKALERATIDAVKEAGLNATVSKVEDIMEIMKFGVMTTPALVINGQVVIKGKVPSVNELKDLFIQKQ